MRLITSVFAVVLYAGVASAATITVTSTSDDLIPNDGSVSLREAISAINAGTTLGDPDIAAQNPTAVNPFGTSDTIAFNIAGAGVHTISVASPLPSITKTVLVDGFTQSGASANTLASGDNATVEIVIDGGTLVATGITITGAGANGTTIRGLSIVRFAGVAVQITDASHCEIGGNFIGVMPDGATEAASPTGVSLTAVAAAATNNSIGGDTRDLRNLIAGTSVGVLVMNGGAIAFDTVIGANLIGTDRSGTAALPSLGMGIHLVKTDNGYIGTTTGATPQTQCSGACNLIVAGNQPGIEVEGLNPTGGTLLAVIQSNFIGTNITGTAALGGTDEILVNGPSGGVTIGGTLPAGNLISGARNQGAGIHVVNDTGGGGCYIQGNYVGTNAAGTAAVGNSGAGILISNSGGINVLNNVVSGNGFGGGESGIQIDGVSGPTMTVNGNLIGVGADNVTPLGNAGPGVALGLLQPVSGSEIGAPTYDACCGNQIANNGGGGVVVKSGSGNSIFGNSIYDNAGIGIDLGGDGVTPNDPCDADSGANNLQNTPVLSYAVPNGAGNEVIGGTLNSTANTTFQLQFFSDSPASGNAQARTFLGYTTVTTSAGCTTSFSFTTPPVTVPAGTKVTATATDPAHNTSEISAPVIAGGAPPVVTMSFSPSSVAPNASSTLTITLTNPNGGALVGVSFADNYPAGLASTSSVSNTCGATINATPGGFTFNGGTIPANGACTVTVNVAASNTGVYTNTLTALLSPSAQPVVVPTATLTVLNAIPVLDPAALLFLALALGGVALIGLRR